MHISDSFHNTDINTIRNCWINSTKNPSCIENSDNNTGVDAISNRALTSLSTDPTNVFRVTIAEEKILDEAEHININYLELCVLLTLKTEKLLL